MVTACACGRRDFRAYSGHQRNAWQQLTRLRRPLARRAAIGPSSRLDLRLVVVDQSPRPRVRASRAQVPCGPGRHGQPRSSRAWHATALRLQSDRVSSFEYARRGERLRRAITQYSYEFCAPRAHDRIRAPPAGPGAIAISTSMSIHQLISMLANALSKIDAMRGDREA